MERCAGLVTLQGNPMTLMALALPLDDRGAVSAGKTKPNRLVPGLV